jgi:hypothetical protein
MNLILYPLLNSKSQRLMTKTRSHYGKEYRYEPNGVLLHRLASATGMSLSKVREQLIKEREYLIQQSAK